MEIEYKSLTTKGITEIDRENGIISAIVAVTGIEDNVKDIIEHGAFTKSMRERTPKGVWSHDWKIPISKTLEMKELAPGDPELPATMANGDPWPAHAGGVKVKTQFNMRTQEGKSAFENVLFFDEEQEWSIGYNVPRDAAYKDSKGVRHIKVLNWYEYSPVLFGAMSNARSVKDAAHDQLMSVKSILGDDAFRAEVKELISAESAGTEQGMSDYEIEMKSGLAPGTLDTLVTMQEQLDRIFEAVAPDYDGDEDFDFDADDAEVEETDSVEGKNLDVILGNLESSGYNTMMFKSALGAMTVAYNNNDVDAVNTHADDILSTIEHDIGSGENWTVDLLDLAKITAAISEAAEMQSEEDFEHVDSEFNDYADAEYDDLEDDEDYDDDYEEDDDEEDDDLEDIEDLAAEDFEDPEIVEGEDGEKFIRVNALEFKNFALNI